MPLPDHLTDFCDHFSVRTKGPLCVALVVTQHARRLGLPLQADKLLTPKGGQVSGLGRDAVQRILNRHGITRLLAKEGGRTSRGSIDNMRQYVAFLNKLHRDALVDLDEIETFWVERVREFFAAQPLKIRIDPSKALRNVVSDILAQAEERQRESTGTHYAGAVLQHLVGAKLDCTFDPGKVNHNSFSTSDSQTRRPGDFLLGAAAIHVTTSPSEAVIVRCQENLDNGLNPVLITTRRGLPVAEGLAHNADCADRVEFFEIEQFVATNLCETAQFEAPNRRLAVTDLVDRYNEIIDDVETDPSMKIEVQ